MGEKVRKKVNRDIFGDVIGASRLTTDSCHIRLHHENDISTPAQSTAAILSDESAENGLVQLTSTSQSPLFQLSSRIVSARTCCRYITTVGLSSILSDYLRLTTRNVPARQLLQDAGNRGGNYRIGRPFVSPDRWAVYFFIIWLIMQRILNNSSRCLHTISYNSEVSL